MRRPLKGPCIYREPLSPRPKLRHVDEPLFYCASVRTRFNARETSVSVAECVPKSETRKSKYIGITCYRTEYLSQCKSAICTASAFLLRSILKNIRNIFSISYHIFCSPVAVFEISFFFYIFGAFAFNNAYFLEGRGGAYSVQTKKFLTAKISNAF